MARDGETGREGRDEKREKLNGVSQERKVEGKVKWDM